MSPIEFNAVISGHTIEIPVEFHDKVPEQVKVILIPEQEAKKKNSFIEQLIANPIECSGFVPLTRDEAHER